MPPKYKQSLHFDSVQHSESIDRLEAILQREGYHIQSISSYTLQASKKIGLTFYSALNFTRPVLQLSVRADEDGNVVLEMRYEWASRYNGSLNDLGKCKRACDFLAEALEQANN